MPVVILSASERLVAVVAVPVRFPVKLDAVMIPEVLALKLLDNVTAKPTLPVPSKDTAEEVATSPETLKSLEFWSAVDTPAEVA